MRLALLLLLLIPFAGLADDGSKVIVQPNSKTNKVTVELGQNVHASMIQILNEEGEVLWTEHKKEQEFTLNMKYYPPGTYNIQVSIFDQVQNYSFVRR